MSAKATGNDRALMEHRTLISFAAPYRYQLGLVALLMLCSSVATLAIPWLAGQMFGQILTPDGTDLSWLVAYLLIALSVTAFLNFAVAWRSGKASARILADLRVKVYQHLQSLPLGFHESHRQGDTLALMTFEVARLSQFLALTLTSIPPLLLTVAGAVFFMFRIDPALALIVPLLVPIFYLILKVVGRRLRGLAKTLQRAEAEVVSIAEQNLEMVPAIKAFTREDAETHRYKSYVEKAMDLNLQESQIYAALQPLIGLAAGAAAVLLTFAAGRNVQEGIMTPSELVSFLLYAALLTRPVGTLADLYGRIQTARGTLARLQSVFAESPEPGYRAQGSLQVAGGTISFRNVSFSHPGREATLQNVNLDIRSGEIVALVGENGAGKSTLMALLLRFYELDSGTICLDGRDIAEVDVRDLRRQIGLVPQRTLLFNGTIRDNIGYGLEGADDEQIEAAARLAQAYRFISLLPHGFETQIGDHGVRLSGGEQQRIALARALVKNPAVLIFDEATSMYDLESESAFVEACRGTLHGRTIIVITHRPASLNLADRILCVRNGAVSEARPGDVPRSNAVREAGS